MTARANGTFGETFVQINPTKLADFIRSDDGPVFRMLVERGERVKVEAQRRVGVYQPPPEGPSRSRRPGTLRDSIVKRIGTSNGAPEVQVGSDDPIALLHHEGTQPHVIPANPMLVFWSRNAGRVIYTTKDQHHPGTNPNRFLTDSLEVLRY